MNTENNADMERAINNLVSRYPNGPTYSRYSRHYSMVACYLDEQDINTILNATNSLPARLLEYLKHKRILQTKLIN